MRQELTCITCPMGCRLVVERPGEASPEGALAGEPPAAPASTAEPELSVTGNRCPRGAAYAREELLAPKRTVTATCRIKRPASADPVRSAGLGAPRRLPCRTRSAFPKDRVPELLSAIYALEVELPVERGAVLIRDALGLGIDVVAARTLH